MERTLYLIRHGTTEANLTNRFAGRTPEPLHPTGIKQMQELGGELQSCNIRRIFCGPLPRTRQSAAILQKYLHTPVTVSDALTEINIPHWDGRTKEEIRAAFGDEYPTWLRNPAQFALPGCETLAEVRDRGIQALERFVNDEPVGNLLLVSHLIVLRCLVLSCRNMTLQEFRTIRIDNGSVVRLMRNGNNGWSVSLQEGREDQ
jgi:broad specificity phosphatase PhoE